MPAFAREPVRWRELPFDELSARDVYDLLALRQLVFVVEQRCAFLDADGRDAAAIHLLGRGLGGELGLYARITPPGLVYPEPSIGRVVSHPTLRRLGLGRQLMAEAIARTRARFGQRPIRIGAQARLEAFYASFGFTVASERYDEDGIEHVEMLLPQ